MQERPPKRPHTRRHPRFLFDSEIRVLPGEAANLVRSRTLDLSQGGISGVFHAEWAVGESVLLQFAVPPAQSSVEVKAVVRDRAGTRYGFEFIDPTIAAAEAIGGACKFLSRSQ